jgi:hypothetical protein
MSKTTLSAVRKMIGEARRAGILGSEEATTLTDRILRARLKPTIQFFFEK